MPFEAAELEELLAAVSRGDRPAFRALYDRTSAKLLGVVLRIIRDRSIADEVLQEAFLRIWQRAHLYAPDAGRPMTWMIAIARYAAIDVVRKRTDALLAAGRDGDSELLALAGPDNPERDVIIRDQLGRCLRELAKPQLECVLLAYCSGYSREELAQHFDRPVATVKSWLHRALIALKLCLEPR